MGRLRDPLPQAQDRRVPRRAAAPRRDSLPAGARPLADRGRRHQVRDHRAARSEEHTSELQSRPHLVCRLLLEKKKTKENHTTRIRASFMIAYWIEMYTLKSMFGNV